MRGRRLGPAALVAALAAALLAGCSTEDADRDPGAGEMVEPAGEGAEDDEAPGRLTLAFGGDVHFEGALAALPGQPRSTLGRVSGVLRDADLAMVNLESALTSGGGAPTDKELEDPSLRYWFRSPPSALDVLARSGVDVVTIANNHGADYGLEGVRESLEIKADAPLAVVGVGQDRAEAFGGYSTTIRGTDVTVLAADAAMRESADPIWASGEGGPGIASARATPPRNLLRAVRRAEATQDLVVVYVHWGAESTTCPTGRQAYLAQTLADAGADVVVGAHAHRLQGSGVLDGAYVNYGLGNFAWYHGRVPESGVLRLRMDGDEVVDEDWLPARIPLAGGPARPSTGAAREAALREWADRRTCAGLEAAPGSPGGPAVQDRDPQQETQQEPDRQQASPEPEPDGGNDRPAYAARVERVDEAIRDRMSASHDVETCPVDLADLRYLRVRHQDFEGGTRMGELVVAASEAEGVVEVFRELYRARFPIARMRLVDAYGADDDRSMAANNSSGYNCRTVAGSDSFSDHAFGRAIDINPIQNPYDSPQGVVPDAGRRFVDADRSPGAPYVKGVVRDGDVVVRAFERIGWEWGDSFADYQHFYVP
ncbi:CapA family protein [Nocardioides sp. CFH 31398]|uniref:CapA family protein n=1 Tax=Nocardioides sp. CFH 31398 TaxID=2919579 RepID=UPI001F0569B6|nr:CapA family protein [Nocardioides sp. CFH 31398]MCH1866089.1 CapA family protein [Nocardioides sp. CFH 31398]